jgi:rhodanese-related sulfurtransferase
MAQHTAAFVALVDDSKSRVREITVADTRKRLQANPKAVLVDVREDREWDDGHAAGARHLGKGIIERDIETEVPDRGAEVILYCGGGFRSALAGDAIQKMGYTNVASMAGGWKAWNAEGGPTER